MDSQRRKKWTPVADPDETVLKTREKRKWQIALRRYLIEKNKCVHYAPYFGLDIDSFRRWIEAQFTVEMNWDNFSTAWQLEHVVPVACFDFNEETDLKLCWSFLNIRVSKIQSQEGQRVDLQASRRYFSELYNLTQLPFCDEMIKKIDSISKEQVEMQGIAAFILSKRQYLDDLSVCSAHEFQQLNEGVSIGDVLAERDLLKKFA